MIINFTLHYLRTYGQYLLVLVVDNKASTHELIIAYRKYLFNHDDTTT